MKSMILVIEDEPAMAMGLRDNLEFEGYEVVTAEDGERGIEEALASTPHCILLDVMLPDGDGFEFCRHLRDSLTATTQADRESTTTSKSW